MTFDFVVGNKTSQIIGIMLKHTDNDREYYTPELSATDQKAIYKILEKYGDNNESIRGDLSVIDLDAQYLPFS